MRPQFGHSIFISFLQLTPSPTALFHVGPESQVNGHLRFLGSDKVNLLSFPGCELDLRRLLNVLCASNSTLFFITYPPFPLSWIANGESLQITRHLALA